MRGKLAAAEQLGAAAARHQAAWKAAVTRGRETEDAAIALHSQLGFLQVRQCLNVLSRVSSWVYPVGLLASQWLGH